MLTHVLLASLLISGPAQDGPGKLTVTDAINAALESNADVQIAVEGERQSAAKTQEQRSALLPNFTGTAGYLNQTINLGAQGLNLRGIPSKIGPFGTSTLQMQFNEPIFDIGLIRQYRAVKQSGATSKFETDAVRNRVAAMVADLYFNAQRARAQVEAERAQIELDERLLKLAQDRKDAGVGTGLDVTRASAQLAVERQHWIEAQNGVRTADLRLLRAMGESPDKQITLDDSGFNAFEEPKDLAAAIDEALRSRPEMKAEENKVHVAHMNASSTQAERLPSIRAIANYGNTGNTSMFIPTDAVGLQLTLPLFDGGLRSAHRAMAASQTRQAETRRRDVHDEIEVEVRIAVDNLRSAQEQLRAANETLRLAEEEIDQAQLRFEAKVTTQVDVVDAQARLALARSSQVNAAYGVRAAKVEFLRATGTLVTDHRL